MRHPIDLPWLKLNEFLIAVGAATHEKAFVEAVIREFARLVPTESHTVFAVIGKKGTIRGQKTTTGSKVWNQEFNDYYWRLMPDVSREEGSIAKKVDWKRYGGSEYVADFLMTKNIHYSIGIPRVFDAEGGLGTFALNRTRNERAFTDEELAIAEFLQPHLNNLYKLYTLKQTPAPLPEPADFISEYPELTRREAEVAALICRRHETDTIGTELFISPRTVHKHIENIFGKLNVRCRRDLIDKFRRDLSLEDGDNHDEADDSRPNLKVR